MNKYKYILIALFFSIGSILQASQNLQEELTKNNIVYANQSQKKRKSDDSSLLSLNLKLRNRSNLFENLPNETTLHVFRFLPLNTLGSLEQVSSQFKSLLELPDVWTFKLRQIGINDFNTPKESCIAHQGDINFYQECLKDLETTVNELYDQFVPVVRRFNKAEKFIKVHDKFLTDIELPEEIKIKYQKILKCYFMNSEKLETIKRLLIIATGENDLTVPNHN